MRTGYITFLKCDISGWIVGSPAILLAGLILLLPLCAFAAEATEKIIEAAPLESVVKPQEEQPVEQQTIEPTAEPTSKPHLIEKIDAQRDYYSEKIVTFTKGIDHFFGDERYFQEANKSVIQINMNQAIIQGGSRPFGVEGQAKLDFPAASRRFQFVFEANPEKKSTGETKKTQSATTTETAAPTQYAASVRYEQAEESLWHFSSEGGFKFHFPLDPFVRTRGSYAIQMGEWRLKMAETVFWFGTIGLGETTQFDMERVLSAPVLFRATSTVTCMEAPQNCDLSQDFAFYHTLDERSAMVYQATVMGANKPVLQETAYVLLMRYRYKLHKEWIFFEVSPQLNFPRTDNFKLNASLLFRLEMLFGATR